MAVGRVLLLGLACMALAQDIARIEHPQPALATIAGAQESEHSAGLAYVVRTGILAQQSVAHCRNVTFSPTCLHQSSLHSQIDLSSLPEILRLLCPRQARQRCICCSFCNRCSCCDGLRTKITPMRQLEMQLRRVIRHAQIKSFSRPLMLMDSFLMVKWTYHAERLGNIANKSRK